MANLPLLESRSVVLNATGTATVIGLGPARYGESWHIKLFSVNTTVRCKFTIHRGNQTTAQYQIDGTNRGDLDTSNTDIVLSTGETISCLWSAGTNGARGTVRIEGTRVMRGY